MGAPRSGTTTAGWLGRKLLITTPLVMAKIGVGPVAGQKEIAGTWTAVVALAQ